MHLNTPLVVYLFVESYVNPSDQICHLGIVEKIEYNVYTVKNVYDPLKCNNRAHVAKNVLDYRHK